ncbi:uncharacterized protein LOC128237248 [Mya arenaria]|uniref:uncharacterized protein LOC128237248 n=1 Tax=Mya arenaria TaxID=6604 RepID=UPI0022E5C5B6|nr:uncharacterized protein LOC128237248 [Mya arenaria]
MSGDSDCSAEKAMSEPIHSHGFNPNPKTINWERLELMRLQKLHLGPERYSRHFQRFQRSEEGPVDLSSSLQRQPTQYVITANGEIKKANSLAPFSTVGKPTCGCFFSRVTDNKKKKIGIPPTNLVKWRSFVQ